MADAGASAKRPQRKGEEEGGEDETAQEEKRNDGKTGNASAVLRQSLFSVYACVCACVCVCVCVCVSGCIGWGRRAQRVTEWRRQ